MIAFAEALKPTPNFPMGSMLNLGRSTSTGTTFGDAGMIAFAGAIKPTAEDPIGSLPALERIVVQTGHENHPALVAACKPRGIEMA